MSNGGLINKIETLLHGGDLTQKAAISLILEAQMSQLKDSEHVKTTVLKLETELNTLKGSVAELIPMGETVKSLSSEISSIKMCVDDIIKSQKEYPSLSWLIRYRTKETVSFLFAVACIIVLMSYIVISNEGFKEMLLKFLGLV